MKNNTDVYNVIRRNSAVEALPRLICEWNYNRYASPTAANTPLDPENVDADEVDYFPIESIVEGRRPKRGLVKARVGMASVANEYSTAPLGPRFYVASPEDPYKYWASPTPSTATGAMPAYAGAGGRNTNTNPRVEYARTVKSNKIVIGIENSYIIPTAGGALLPENRVTLKDYEVWIKPTVAGTWIKIGDQASAGWSFDMDGRLTLYRQDDNSWSTVFNRDTVGDLAGVELRVKSLTKANQYFNLIEISARLEQDMTQYLTSVNDTFDMGETDFSKPLGRASSNVATVNFFNDFIDGGTGFLLNNNNPNSFFYGLLDANVKFTLEYVYATGAGEKRVTQFTMYSEGLWEGGDQAEVSVALRDSSKFLQEIKPRPLFYQGATIGAIVWQLCDTVGFNNYLAEASDSTPDSVIPYFWTDGESTVWEVLSSLAEGTQTGIWFDGNDNLQIKTRNKVYDETATPVWTLRGEDDGVEYADIATWDDDEAMEANTVTVSYQTTEFEPDKNGFPVTEVLWEPEGDLVLRAADLGRNLLTTDAHFLITPGDAKVWPYSGVVNIEGEFISFKAKHYRYYNRSGALISVNVFDADQLKNIQENLTDPNRAHLAAFTGSILIDKRGIWNSTPRNHMVEASGYNLRYLVGANRVANMASFIKQQRVAAQRKKNAEDKKAWKAWLKKQRKKGIEPFFKDGTKPWIKPIQWPATTGTNGIKQISNDSRVVMESQSYFNGGYWQLATRGASDDDAYFIYGSRIRFEASGQKDQIAGLAFNITGPHDACYFVQLIPTRRFNATNRKSSNEVMVGKRKIDGTVEWYGGQSTVVRQANTVVTKKGKRKTTYTNVPVFRGMPFPIVEGQWYDVEVNLGKDGGQQRIAVSVNGRHLFTASIPNAEQHPESGEFGMMTRGHTKASFEYLYAVGKRFADPTDGSGAYDRLRGGYVSDQLLKEWVWETKTETKRVRGKPNKKIQVRKAGLFFDEFGPIVHEVREFDVKFEKVPALATRLYFNNDFVACPEYYADAQGAHFMLANTSRNTEVINGDETRGDSTVSRKTYVYGRPLMQRDAKEITFTDEASVRARGPIETTLESKWIQSEAAAKALGEWVKKHWAFGQDMVNVSVFGNPLLEVGDVVAAEHPDVSATAATHKYVIVAISNSFESGLETTLTLRRLKV